ncbi:MAG: hypothetical protein ACLT8E_08045 [Akkermansia sp.]
MEVLGYPDDPHVDMEAVIRKYDLPVGIPRLRASGGGIFPEKPFFRGTGPPGGLDGPHRHHH